MQGDARHSQDLVPKDVRDDTAVRNGHYERVTERPAVDRPPAIPRWLDVVADPVRLHILRSLSRVKDATRSELAASGNLTEATLRRHLEPLVALGVIHERPGASDGQTQGRPPARFVLHPEVRTSLLAISSPPAPARTH
jgi:DNA-binding transcriptional ArsR family regulator